MNHSNGDNGAHFCMIPFQRHLLIVAFVHTKNDSSGSACQIVGFRKLQRCQRQPPEFWSWKHICVWGVSDTFPQAFSLKLSSPLLFSTSLGCIFGRTSGGGWSSPNPQFPPSLSLIINPHSPIAVQLLGTSCAHSHRLMCELMWAQAGGWAHHFQTQWTTQNPLKCLILSHHCPHIPMTTNDNYHSYDSNFLASAVVESSVDHSVVTLWFP